MKSLLLICSIYFFLACTSSPTNKAQSAESPVPWSFSEHGVYMNEKGLSLQGTSLIQNHLSTHSLDLGALKTIYAVPATTDSVIEYKISNALNKLNETLIILSILKKDQSDPIAELVFLSKSSPTRVPLDELASRRNEWMKHCNEHHVAVLVSELYTPDALYFNHKPLIKGTAEITKEYGYMNTSNYHLELTPLHIEPVSDSLIYEIGQGSGSYGGKYILVWKKNAEGKWMVYMDSNI